MLRPSPLRLCLLVGVLFGAAPVFAQEPATRAEELRRARQEKSEHLAPPEPSGLERALLDLENGRMFAGPTTGWAVRFLGATNEFQWDFSDGSNINQSGTSPEAAWYHLLGTMDAGTATLYINGASVGTATPTIGTPTQGTVWGNWAGNVTAANGWNGQFSQLALWSRVLTADEIADLYNFGLNGV